jgi:hypothetical protein
MRGLKKPLNMLETPVYPDLKKDSLRFQWSGKSWKVDEGKQLMQTEAHSQFSEPAVLVQSRSYNQQIYGQSSSKDVVNKHVRLPMLNQDDLLPLSRQPRYLTVPRLNPSTAGHVDGSSYAAKNERNNDIDKHISDRVHDNNIRPTFFAPIEMPIDNSVLPDLETKLPQRSITTGFNTPFTLDAPNFGKIRPGVTALEYEKLQSSRDPGLNIPFYVDGPRQAEHFELYDTRPQISALAGVEMPVTVFSRGDLPDLPERVPVIPITAGINTGVYIDQRGDDPNYEYKSPSISASSGIESNYRTRTDNQTSTDILLPKKISAGHTVLNPAPVDGYSADNHALPSHNIKQSASTRENFSYMNPSDYTGNIHNKDSNMSAQCRVDSMYRKKQECLSSYKGYDNKGFIPRAGITTQRVELRTAPRQSTAKYTI